ncbi:hypothetical protein [Bacillus salipaludis]|uniref:EAL domain-containing protein n=1 Tax=Bacillus salipaludis TaxID=2547811 RepID=A0ABW8RHV8_9BACI
MKTTILDLPRPNIKISESLSFFHVFQPIFSLQNETIYGYEYLERAMSLFQKPLPSS